MNFHPRQWRFEACRAYTSSAKSSTSPDIWVGSIFNGPGLPASSPDNMRELRLRFQCQHLTLQTEEGNAVIRGKTMSDPVREQVLALLNGGNAHVPFDKVVKDFPAKRRGVKPDGAPHTAWQLLEHMRIAQWDILEFS